MATGEQNPAHDTCPPNQATPQTTDPPHQNPAHDTCQNQVTRATTVQVTPQTTVPPHQNPAHDTCPPNQATSQTTDPQHQNPASSNQATSQTTDPPHQNPAHDTCPQNQVTPATTVPAHRLPSKARIPVDGGWGWVVVFSSFLISAVVDGIGFSVGIFFSSFEKEFGSNKQQTSWVSSALNGTYLIIGPLISVFINRYGCRKVAAFGCVLASVAFCLATLSPSIEVLIATYGVVGGLGLGFLYQPAVVIVGYYFVRRRGLALGITCCGSGTGAFAFAPLFGFFLDTFDWRSTTYLIALMVLLCACACATFRPIEDLSVDTQSCCELHNVSSLNSLEMRIIVQANETRRAEIECEMLKKAEKSKSGDHVSKGTTSSLPHPCISNKTEVAVADSEIRMPMNGQQDKTSVMDTGDSKESPQKPNPEADCERPEVPGTNEHQICRDKNVNRKSDASVTSKFSKGLRTELKKDPEEFLSSTASSIRRHLHRLVWVPFLLNCRLMKQVSFALYSTACFLMSVGIYVPTTFLPPVAEEQHFDSSQAAMLVSTIGLGGLLARLCVGCLEDRYRGISLSLNCTALLVAGLATCFLPFVSSYPLLLAYSFLFGASIGAVMSLQVVILIDMLGLSELTSAFGLVNMYHGIGTFIGPPLAGSIWDAMGDVHYSFVVVGAVMTCAGAICLPLRRVSAWERGTVNAVSSQARPPDPAH